MYEHVHSSNRDMRYEYIFVGENFNPNTCLFSFESEVVVWTTSVYRNSRQGMASKTCAFI